MQRWLWSRMEMMQNYQGDWVKYADAEAELELERSLHMGRERDLMAEVRAAVEKEREEICEYFENRGYARDGFVVGFIRSRGEQKPGKRIEHVKGLLNDGAQWTHLTEKLNEVIDALNALLEAKP